MENIQPRGLRNNNPLNIRRSHDVFQGELKYNPDKDFKRFSSLLLGIRAAICIIRTYMMHHNLHTPSEIISRWAPGSENATENYINIVCARAHFEKDEVIYFRDAQKVIDLVEAMIWVECGTAIQRSVITSAYNLV